MLDFDNVDEALALANGYQEILLPHRLVRSVSLQNEHREDGSWLNLDASLGQDGALRINGQDLGPVTKIISPDGEYGYFYTIAGDDIPALVIAPVGNQALMSSICWNSAGPVTTPTTSGTRFVPAESPTTSPTTPDAIPVSRRQGFSGEGTRGSPTPFLFLIEASCREEVQVGEGTGCRCRPFHPPLSSK